MGATLSTTQTINGQLFWQMPSPDDKHHWNIWIRRPPPGESLSIPSADGKGYHLCTAATNPAKDTIKTETSLLTQHMPEEAFMYTATGQYTKNPNWLPQPYTEQTYQKRFCQFDTQANKWFFSTAFSRPCQEPLLATNITDDWIYIDSGDTFRSCGLAPLG